MSRKRIIMYSDYWEPIQRLEDAEAGRWLKAILQFANDGIKADFPGAVGVAYSFITSQISATR